jgi:hypothetical protein
MSINEKIECGMYVVFSCVIDVMTTNWATRNAVWSLARRHDQINGWTRGAIEEFSI